MNSSNEKASKEPARAYFNFPSPNEDDNDKMELVLRPMPTITTPTDNENLDRIMLDGIPDAATNKRLRAVKSVPYFSFRPASENDIFAITGGSMNSLSSVPQISMTPEIPSISYTALPKNYEDTPRVEKYKESMSLHSIQTANLERAADLDFSMPRYFGKADIIAQSADNLVKKTGPKKVEKSKRLKLIRNTLPPLAIHISKEKSKEKNIE